MIFVIGDIHGEVSKLFKLLRRIESLDKTAIYVFVGDYIDKGENPMECLQLLDKLSKENKCTFLIGNHEYIWINLKENDKNAFEYLSKYGGLNTIKSFNQENIYATKELMVERFSSFFDKLVPFWINEKYVITHSGFEPAFMDKNLKKIPIKKLLFNRYEFIKQERYFKNKKMIFGHTGFYVPYVDSFKIGIDTAACFLKNQPLTAFCLEEEFFINSKGEVSHLKYIKSDRCPNIVRVKPWRN